MQLELNLNIVQPSNQDFLNKRIDDAIESNHKVRKKLFASDNALLKRMIAQEERIDKLERLVNEFLVKDPGESWEYQSEGKLFKLKEVSA